MALLAKHVNRTDEVVSFLIKRTIQRQIFNFNGDCIRFLFSEIILDVCFEFIVCFVYRI
jgi:hypothetical protein